MMATGAYKLAIFGDPVGHSLSPQIHQQFAQQCNVQVDYRPRHVAAEGLAEALAAFAEAGGDGLNLTVPHKTAVIPFCETLSPRAQAAGAVNTLIREGSGWRGDNTDGAGLLWDLSENLRWRMAGRSLVIVGAGGAAAGVLPALLSAPWCQVILTNRNLERARCLGAQHGDRVTVCDLESLVIPEGALIVNATSCGHDGECPPLPVPDEACDAYDLNYGAAAQPFLRWASAAGLRVSDGLGMLVAQAAEAFTLWTDKHPDPYPVLEYLRA